MKTTAVLIMVICLFGCAHPINPTIKSFNTFAPGVVQTKQVGEALFEKGTINVMPGFRAQRDCNLPLMEHLLFPPLKRGDLLACKGRLDNGDYLCAKQELRREEVQTDSGAPLPDDLPLFMITPGGELRGLFFAGNGNTVTLEESQRKSLFVPAEITSNGSFKEELVYDGKSDDIIKLSYREFAGDLTRPSLFQGFSYNMASLDIIRIRDVIIEVLEATDSTIRYVVKN
jgi:hypothetical protein